MAMNKFRIIWSLESKNNVKKINNNISKHCCPIKVNKKEAKKMASLNES